MTPHRWKRVHELMSAALDRPTQERAALLTEACAGDADLRAEVESLIACSVSADEFLETGDRAAVLGSLAEAEPESPARARIGAYKVLSEIGRGGMGAVFLAERDDQEYRKRVAIKLVRNDADSASVVHRFRQERQILAELDHPNIARLLDGGTTDEGMPYFVMEHVEGTPLDAYCEAKGLSVEERLVLFRTVCAAVGVAHQKLVVHRDLKPGNILVTAEGTPKLLDFGIAKLLAPPPGSERTVTGARLMTPEYASPEQWCGGFVGVASDVYSLGVILYRLLAGQSPYRVGVDLPHELARAVCEEDPRPPSAAAPQTGRRLTGDLDAIVLQALRKEPERRYGTAEELSDDIRRHLAGLPVTARKDGLAYRAGRFVRRNRAVAVTALAMAVSAAVLSVSVYRWARVVGPDRPAATVGTITSLAVLPLTNLSRDPEQDFFADGMTEALITDLSKIGSLRVISRTSVMGYKGTAKALPEIARELKVDGVVEGSVLRSQDSVRITAQLIRAVDDKQLWAESYERNLTDVIALQREVARAIAIGVKGKLTAQDQARLATRPVDPKAYLAYVRGRYLWNKRTDESLKAAFKHFEEAIKYDPAYAAAYSGLADSHFYVGYYFGKVPPREAMPKAKQAALKALELDEASPEAHASLAHVMLFYDWDLPGAEREFQRALELNPQCEMAHHGYSALLAVQHRWDDSVAEARRALEADPLSLVANHFLGLILGWAGRYDEALEQYRRNLELDPDMTGAQFGIADIYWRKGMKKQSVEHRLKWTALVGQVEKAESLRRAYEQGGIRGMRKRDLEMALAEWKGWHWATGDIAALYADLGQPDEAMKWLEKAYEARSAVAVLIPADPDAYKPLHSDPRFQDLLRRVGLPR